MRNKTPLNRPILGLRNEAHQVELIMPNGMTRPLLGTRHPAAEDQRASVIAQSGGPRAAVRQEQSGTIDVAAEQRTQTILMHRLPRTVQQRLNGTGDQSGSRTATGTGTEPLNVADIDD
jgi:hypothetical protein